MKTIRETLFGYLTCLIFLIFSAAAFSQDFSNRGKDFWVSHMGHTDGSASSFILYISAPVNTTGTVSVPLQGWSTPFTAAGNSMVTVTVPSSIGYVGCSDCLEQRGIHIVSDNDIAVHAQIYHAARTDASLILPTKVLGKEYYAMCMTQYGGEYSEFLVVAVEDSTQVEIIPTALTLGGNPANVPFTITLQQGEVYQVKSATDLTGSKITAISTGNNDCKKIAVFSGSTWNSPGCGGGGSGDNLFEQAYPITTWGKNFITSPLKTRLGGDIFRVMADSNATTVTINGLPLMLNQGQYFDTILTTASYFTADKPVVLAQYARSGSCDGVTGDPLMIILNPVEQTVNNVLLYSTSYQSITGEYINVVMKTADIGGFLLDGSAVVFSPVPSNPIYSFSQNTVTVGVHTLVADSGFNAIAYGFGSPEAYGYLAGANVKNLQQKMVLSEIYACDGSTISFTGSAAYTPVSWKWYFGDGTTSSSQNDTHTYADTGTYTVSLVTVKPGTTGCDSKDSSYTEIHILGKPIANFNTASVCFGDSMLFNDLSITPKGGTVNTWHWNFGDNNSDTLQNTTHQYSVCDTFNIKFLVISDNGCSDSIVKTATVYCLPIADFNSNDVCKNQPTIFNDSAQGTVSSWLWDFGDTTTSVAENPNHTYSGCGVFSAKLLVITTDGCKDSITKPVTVHCLPVANFSFVPVCLHQSMSFADSSTISSGSIASRLWDFGDGSPASSVQNPNHLYLNHGTYSVSLISISTNGCFDTITKNVVVHPLPEVQFSATNTCAGTINQFNDSSAITITDTILTYQWIFGDGSPVNNSQNCSHLYASAGFYNVQLAVTTTFGCIDSLIKTAIVYPNPVAYYTAPPVCNGFNTTFIDSSTTASGTLLSWKWQMGDASTDSIQNPVHLYAAAGNYNTSLIINNSWGCADTATKNILVYDKPVSGFNHNDICLGQSMNFTDSSTIANGTILYWLWNYGDNGLLDSSQNTSHLYTSYGSYPVTLIVISNNGCSDTIINNVVVHPLPNVGFNKTNVCLGAATTFSDTSTIPLTDTMDYWNWNFGDNSQPDTTTNNPSHTYATTGSFSVKLIVTSGFGCADSSITTAIVNPNPVVMFAANDTMGCEPLCISLQNSSFVPGGSIASWSWSFGDNTPNSNSQDILHCYYNDTIITPRLFSPTLTVTSDSGCVSILTKNNYITVFPGPVVQFTVIPQTATYTDPVININNSTIGANAWNWNFGDLQTDSIYNPAPHVYADTGSYIITLIASTQYNCLDTAYQTIIVEPEFLVYIPNAFTPNDDGINDTFLVMGMFIIDFEMNIFDRWGNLIYKTNSIDKPWNGKANNGNQPAQTDVYIYSIKIIDFQSKKHIYRGTVTTIR